MKQTPWRNVSSRESVTAANTVTSAKRKLHLNSRRMPPAQSGRKNTWEETDMEEELNIYMALENKLQDY